MDLLSDLVDSLRCLPGVGPKSAQRMAFALLQGKRQQGLMLAARLEAAMRHIKHCMRCNNYTSDDLCMICQNKDRDANLLCVVETAVDVTAIEQSGAYKGYYFVLMGRISPLNGIGPNDIGLDKLQARVVSDNLSEVIVALSSGVEGQSTMHFIRSLLEPYSVTVSQLAHGIPSGGELEFLDSNTIRHALSNRAAFV